MAKPKKIVWPCPHCPQKYTLKQTLNNHKNRVHSTNLTLKCAKCERELHSKFAIDRHIKQNRCKLSTRNMKCNHCGTELKNLFNFDRHILNLHTAASSPIQCSECPTSFATRFEFKLHKVMLEAKKKHFTLPIDEQSRINMAIDNTMAYTPY